ncbi:MAG: hypothetical protein CFE23_00110 [Flavobacterium sp. BFFFF1]|uniref:hypothetical protein n=1 Tax=Flavobacterium sp. BFFFF1 TaxID=2015557 RepID=UPI000BCD7D44|nr:hypothetical protein [Flavobacterium sp. BFFFF1]OYU82165.1 MAG: hypothetical protein CFE23_00110 [Flavobacterium sp. BFFFF1]
MGKLHLVYGALIGIAATVLGSLIFTKVAFPSLSFAEGLATLKAGNQLGKVITIGAVLNLIAFFTLLKLRKEQMAWGVIYGTVCIAIATIFV